jgi:hypothetical protein
MLVTGMSDILVTSMACFVLLKSLCHVPEAHARHAPLTTKKEAAFTCFVAFIAVSLRMPFRSLFTAYLAWLLLMLLQIFL